MLTMLLGLSAAASSFCSVFIDTRRSHLPAWDVHFRLVTMTKILMFVCKLYLIGSRFDQDMRLYPSEISDVDKAEMCEKQGGIVLGHTCWFQLCWRTLSP